MASGRKLKPSDIELFLNELSNSEWDGTRQQFHYCSFRWHPGIIKNERKYEECKNKGCWYLQDYTLSRE